MDQSEGKAESPFREGQKVKFTITRQTELGYAADIDIPPAEGLLYANEVFQDIRPGDNITGYISHIRPDGKLDLSLYPKGRAKVNDLLVDILHLLERRGGFLGLHDRSDPEDIYTALGVSKKSYKQAIGALYKQKRILIEEDGIRLNYRTY